ncbi:predicted protein [Arabidopsis lyrata subsp. lyrata]|uniref:Predicted protein n=1 Tax=Arabidopsis lyrata subsp. lyrata TaxID=81972 RepID=D7LJB0_ARALL|nr:predicted protein [Arabidopsis lyrata subsp. lyrata]
MENEDHDGPWSFPKKPVRARNLVAPDPARDPALNKDITKAVTVFIDMDTTQLPDDHGRLNDLRNQIENALKTCDPTLHVSYQIYCYGIDNEYNKSCRTFLKTRGYEFKLNPSRGSYCGKPACGTCQDDQLYNLPSFVPFHYFLFSCLTYFIFAVKRYPKKDLTELIMTQSVLLHAFDSLLQSHSSRHILLVSGDGNSGSLRKGLTKRNFITYAAVCGDSKLSLFIDMNHTWYWSRMVEGGLSIQREIDQEEAEG